MMKKLLYLDMDGVLADFEGGFAKRANIAHNSVSDEAMWEIINAWPDFFRQLPVMDGAKNFFAHVEELQPIILTACPRSNYKAVADQKREWIREHISTEILICPVMGGVNKPLFMNAPGDVLVDDHERNCRVWREANGIAIQHQYTDFDATLFALKSHFAI